MKISKYKALPGEANFGKPISSQIKGGTHITFEMVTHSRGTFYMTRWPKGLPGHEDPSNSLRFPHGLIRRGESLEDCAERLVSEQLGMRVKSVRFVYWDSYIDEYDHWHIEPGCLVEVAGKPRTPDKASEIVTFHAKRPPDMTFWPKEDFHELLEEHLPEVLT